MLSPKIKTIKKKLREDRKFKYRGRIGTWCNYVNNGGMIVASNRPYLC